ncbi:MAG: hypothetical protein ABSC55_11290 [Syntrophorhabdales bacterium]|jgi:hypothetical protein
MPRQKYVCPIIKKTCIRCSLYRGRHIGLWAGEESGEGPAHAATAPSNGNDSDWVASFDTFVKDVADLEGRAADWD